MADPYKSSFGSFFKAVACGAASAVAAGTGDATKVTGASIDRLGYGSGKLTIAYKTTLTADKTLGFAVEYEESADGSSWDAPVVIQALTTAETGAQTNKVGQVSFDIDLSARKQHVRYNVTPDLSHTSADTVVFGVTFALGGASTLPAA